MKLKMYDLIQKNEKQQSITIKNNKNIIFFLKYCYLVKYYNIL